MKLYTGTIVSGRLWNCDYLVVAVLAESEERAKAMLGVDESFVFSEVTPLTEEAVVEIDQYGQD